jgi:UDP-glucose:glycoprotein glucosyltransferase
MRAETISALQLRSLGFSSTEALDLKVKPLESAEKEIPWGECFNTETDAVFWLNDLTNDRQYSYYPKSIPEVLASMRPNSFAYVQSNLFNVLLFVDFENPKHLMEISRIYQIMQQSVPWRFGLVPIIKLEDDSFDENDPKVALVHAFYYFKDKSSHAKADFLQALIPALQEQPLSSDIVKRAFQASVGKSFLDNVDLGDISVFEKFKGINSRLGVSLSGAIFANGKFFSVERDWTQNVLQLYMSMISHLRHYMSINPMDDSFDAYYYFLHLSNVYPTRNMLVFPNSAKDIKIVNLLELKGMKSILPRLFWVHPNTDSPVAVSLVVVADFSSHKGLDLASHALEVLKETQSFRLLLIDSAKDVRPSAVNSFFQQEGSVDTLANLISKIAEGLEDVASTENTINDEFLENLIKGTKLSKGDSAILLNGRLLVMDNKKFGKDEFSALIEYESRRKITGLEKSLIQIMKTRKFDLSFSDLVLLASSALPGKTEDDQRFNSKILEQFEEAGFFFHFGATSACDLVFEAMIQPLDPLGQKILSFLDQVKALPGVCIKVFALAMPLVDIESIPLNRFYRFTLEAKLNFNSKGMLAPTKTTFSGMPKASLLTMGIDTPGSWLIRPVSSVYDLDNIKLTDLSDDNNVDAVFSLHSLLVEGILAF